MNQMLREHYKLAIQPFGVTPDPTFLYLSETHREALASLLHGVRSHTGFSALIAAPGMGKTTLLFSLLQALRGNTQTAFLFQTLCRPGGFLNALLADLGIQDNGRNIARMHAKLNEYLLRESQNGRQVVVIIDEAQNLNAQVLEVVRMLSNFETSNKKLLHVILAGQPQLAEKLNLESLIQLRQRISIVARLAPLTPQETRGYVEHRLMVAGHSSGKPLFTSDAYAMIAEQSQGIPRNINTLCFNSMSLGCALKRPVVDKSMVEESVNDLDLGTITFSPGMSKERSVPVPGLDGRIFSTARWRIQALLGFAVLISLVWIFTQFVKRTSKEPGRQAASVRVMELSSAGTAQTGSGIPAEVPWLTVISPLFAPPRATL